MTRRKRCDGRRPGCAACQRLNLDCVYGQRQRPAESTTSYSISTTQPALLPSNDGRATEAAEQRALLQFYMGVFVPTVSVASVPSSFYTSLYMPMALQCSGVLGALIACSALHQARLGGDTTRIQHLRSLSAKHQARCLAFLGERISSSGEPLKEPYEVTAVTLLLIGLEATKSTGYSAWLRQLHSDGDCCAILALRKPRTTAPGSWSACDATTLITISWRQSLRVSLHRAIVILV